MYQNVIASCKNNEVSTKNCGCALTNCVVGQVCVDGTKCQYPGKIVVFVQKSIGIKVK